MTVAVPASDPSTVLCRATLQAARRWHLQSGELAQLLQMGQAALAEWVSGSRRVDPDSPTGRTAQALVRAHRALEALLGGDSPASQAWLASEHPALGGIPRQQMVTPEGLRQTLAYLEGLALAGALAPESPPYLP